MTSLQDKVAEVARAYAPHEHRPLSGYLAAMGGLGVLAASLAAAARISGRPVPERPAVADVALVSIATHKLSRLIAKDAVTSPLRAPFTRYAEPAGAAELNEEVRDSGSSVKHGIGELVTCPFCLAVWVATGLTGGLVLAPRLTRLVATALTATAVSDFLQMAYSMAKEKAE
ncbi:DUF1360 domain-containing protein [Actinoplanes siamensis]|uniref:DUF1360 domain-containing protein n=1 Tax=Actinoplanes siamensis TaxID=1223317 RepID=A0A919NCJ6_9ACTN|nr:DUF1360 domain-containing protein [Actinoplanes siamensis]GIF08621.1 hypothetical protein Asi03nite_61590 [Actinoplanes siamensis]